MKKKLFWTLLSLLLVFLGFETYQKRNRIFRPPASPDVPWTPHPEVLNLQEAFVGVAKMAKHSVANISTVHVERGAPRFYLGDPWEDFLQQFFYGQRPPPRTQEWRTQGMGSGFLIDSRGYILTNEHVVRGADEIRITLIQQDGVEKTYPGQVAGRDPTLDLAVVRIAKQGTYPALKLGDSSRVRVGDWAIAIGSPFGLEQTVTAGIVSAVRQSVSIENRVYPNLLQTDAAINRGNSGGPLLNIRGEVIGINTAIYTPSGAFAGVGFAIPIDEVKQILDQLLQGAPIARGWLGIETVPTDPVIQKRFRLPEQEGALVNEVIPSSPAEKAGLERGDVLLKFNGQKVKDPSHLVLLVTQTPPGKRVALEVLRQGRLKKLWVTMGDRSTVHPAGAKSKGQTWEGILVAVAEEGVEILEIEAGSKLRGYLQPGDILKGMDQTRISTLNDFQKAAAVARLADGVVFDILRNGQPMYISVQSAE
ncbi:MAG: trypsin-like peptidase domain-containing protein [Elusimicrobia bacterium]|nr:trypsin-like peptidase domain-containing protein [Elusimicrobiota bacterium]